LLLVENVLGVFVLMLHREFGEFILVVSVVSVVRDTVEEFGSIFLGSCGDANAICAAWYGVFCMGLELQVFG